MTKLVIFVNNTLTSKQEEENSCKLIITINVCLVTDKHSHVPGR